DAADVLGPVDQVEGDLQGLQGRGGGETGGPGADDQHLLAGGDLVVEVGHRAEPSGSAARGGRGSPDARLSGGLTLAILVCTDPAPGALRALASAAGHRALALGGPATGRRASDPRGSPRVLA